MPDNPYDGHTLAEQMEQVGILTDIQPATILVDCGYRGVEPLSGTQLLISHTRKLPARLKRLFKRRQVGVSMIGHMNADPGFWAGTGSRAPRAMP